MMTGNVVLMGTRHHRTQALAYLTAVIECPVEMGPGTFSIDIKRSLSIHFKDIYMAKFVFQGDFLRGDPIYLQTKGPELPDSWWKR